MGDFALRTDGLTKRYGRLTALDDLRLQVHAGEVFGFLGPNGAGKSTIIRLLLGQARPTSGRAEVFGIPAGQVIRTHALMAYVPADVALWPQLTGSEILHLQAATGPGTDLAYRAELVERFDLDLSRAARTYSTGNRQKVALVAALATRAPLLVLDEPTSGLDPLMEREFRLAVGQARERGWAAGIGAYFLLIGLTAVSLTEFLGDNRAFADEAADAGFAGLDSIAGFTATLFAILAIPVGAFTAVRMTAFVAAEIEGRLVLLAAQPIRRTRLIGAELAVTAAGASLLTVEAGIACWAGVAATGGDYPLTAALRGAVNVLPVVLLSLGAALFAAGWLPRWTGWLGAVPATGGFLLLVIAESVGAPVWIREMSPFAHLSPVPSAAVDWAASTVMVAVAGLLVAAGVFGYRRRDWTG